MTTVAVVYFSGAGHTHLMAEAVAEGAGQLYGQRIAVATQRWYG
jgi:NAD(P)H dehydrogenase (quinone)